MTSNNGHRNDQQPSAELDQEFNKHEFWRSAETAGIEQTQEVQDLARQAEDGGDWKAGHKKIVSLLRNRHSGRYLQFVGWPSYQTVEDTTAPLFWAPLEDPGEELDEGPAPFILAINPGLIDNMATLGWLIEQAVQDLWDEVAKKQDKWDPAVLDKLAKSENGCVWDILEKDLTIPSLPATSDEEDRQLQQWVLDRQKMKMALGWNV